MPRQEMCATIPNRGERDAHPPANFWHKSESRTRRKFMSQPEQFEVLILGSGRGESYWLGIWRDRGGGQPSWNAGGSEAPAPTSPACPARMRFGARGLHI